MGDEACSREAFGIRRFSMFLANSAPLTVEDGAPNGYFR